MKRRASRLPYMIAVLGAGILVLLAWESRDRFTPVGPGTEAPGFALPDLEGNTVSLEGLRGTVVLVNIWATWCPPCREEMPSMQRLYESLEGQPFEILAVSVDARVGQRDPTGNVGGDVGDFVRSYGLTFPTLLDPSGKIQETYQTTGVPESFLVGKDGVIYRKIAGATVWDSPRYRELIQRLLDS